MVGKSPRKRPGQLLARPAKVALMGLNPIVFFIPPGWLVGGKNFGY